MSTLRVWGAFIRRDFAIDRSYPLPMLLRALSLFPRLMMIYYLSRIVSGSTIREASGFDDGYFAFALVGFLAITPLVPTLASFANAIRNDQITGTLETLLAMPQPRRAILLGSGLYGIVSALGLTLIELALAVVVFGFRPHVDAEVVACILAAGGSLMVLVGALGVAMGAFTMVFKNPASILGLAAVAISLLAGVFYPVEVLPPVLREIGEAIPLHWALQAMRAAVSGQSIPWGGVLQLAIAALLAVPVAAWLFRASLRHALRKGTLSHY